MGYKPAVSRRDPAGIRCSSKLNLYQKKSCADGAAFRSSVRSFCTFVLHSPVDGRGKVGLEFPNWGVVRLIVPGGL